MLLSWLHKEIPQEALTLPCDVSHFQPNPWPAFNINMSEKNNLFVTYQQDTLISVRSKLVTSVRRDLGIEPSLHFRLSFNHTCNLLAQSLPFLGLNGLAEISTHDVLASTEYEELSIYWVEIVSHLTGSWAMENLNKQFVLEILGQQNTYGSSFHGAILRFVTLLEIDGSFWSSAMALLQPYAQFPHRVLQFDVFHPVGHGLLYVFAHQILNLGTISACTVHVMFSHATAVSFSSVALHEVLSRSLAVCAAAPASHEAVWCAQGVFHTFFEYLHGYTTGSLTTLWPCDVLPFEQVCFWWLQTFKGDIELCTHAKNKQTELACLFGFSAASFRRQAVPLCHANRNGTNAISVMGLFCSNLMRQPLRWISADEERGHICINGSLDTLARMKYSYARSDEALTAECLRAGVTKQICASALSDESYHIAEWRVI